MASLTLIDALKSIQDGRSAEILDQLYHLRKQNPKDIATNYVLAHALEACEKGTRAESIWKAAGLLQAEDESPVIPEPSDIPAFEAYGHFSHKIGRNYWRGGRRNSTADNAT